MKKMLLSAFVALTFGVSTFANQIAKDENFEFDEEMVIDCAAVAEALLQRDMQNNPNEDWNHRAQSNRFNLHFDNCVNTGLCTTCGKPVVVGLVP